MGFVAFLGLVFLKECANHVSEATLNRTTDAFYIICYFYLFLTPFSYCLNALAMFAPSSVCTRYHINARGLFFGNCITQRPLHITCLLILTVYLYVYQ